MHGYFMDQRLHRKLKAAMDPFAFEEYRKQKIKQRLDAKRTMRTHIRKVKVNTQLHQQLRLAAEDGALEGASKKRRAAAEHAQSLLNEKRFEALFADPDFAREEEIGAQKLEPLSAVVSSGGKKVKKLKEK
mmetsp:Transcript_9984/g.23527  ORF Transcript_9984/g.23527 Transcript_9984/m.23527 type:complete len:131 (+) Transcript_9984:458-850(+)